MHKFHQLPGTRRKQFLRATSLATLAIPILAGFIGAAATRAQSQTQDKSANRPALEYDVASIKLIIPGSGVTNMTGRIGMTDTPDGFIARFATVKMLVLKAYAVDDYQLTGAPDWVSKERYDIDAKFDGSTADELQKLNPTDRVLARQQMLQTLLAERFSLTIHRENKELQIYSLIVAKNGPKLQEVKLDDAESDKPKGGPAAGTGTMVVGGTGGQIRGYTTTLATLTTMLTRVLHRFVIDRTGLTEKYDFTLRWTPDENQLPPSSGAQVSPAGASSGLPSTDPNPNSGPSLFTAIQEQLGLKLESAKGPVEFIVIDHIERPSGN
jgi:uncharacterized protein (TIGR03435 family)